MIYKNKNFSFGHLSKLAIEDNDEFISCNFSQAQDTEIGAGKIGLKFKECNGLNCVAPVDAVIEGGLWIKKSFCTHLHPDYSPPLPPCLLECQHLTGIDTIEIDDVEVEKAYNYEDKVV